MNKITGKRVQFLKAHPQVTALIFSLSADGVPMTDIPAQLEKKNPNMPKLNAYAVRQVIHKEYPYNASEIFKDVLITDAQRVKQRMHTPTKKVENRSKVSDTSKAEAIALVVTARQTYDQAMLKAVEATGHSAADIHAWIGELLGS